MPSPCRCASKWDDAVIDNLEKTERLLCELEESLPLDARVLPQLAVALQDKAPGLEPFQPCRIVQVHYTGDEGGIVCLLDLVGADDKSAILASITHLAFDRRLPLARQISAYQKHRTKRIRRGATADLTMELDPSSAWRRGTFQIASGNGPETVEGIVAGNFGIRDAGYRRPSLVVTHLPTGLLLTPANAGFQDLGFAKMFVERLAGLADWSSVDPQAENRALEAQTVDIWNELIVLDTHKFVARYGKTANH
jgi:hypothetical protein